MPIEIWILILGTLLALLFAGSRRLTMEKRKFSEARIEQIRRARHLRGAYGLTREEAYLAMHIASGGSLAAHSRQESLPIDAIRKATKRICAKMERSDRPNSTLLSRRLTTN